MFLIWFLSEADQEEILLLSIAHYRQFSYHVTGEFISPDCLTAKYFGESDKVLFKSYASLSFLLEREYVLNTQTPVIWVVEFHLLIYPSPMSLVLAFWRIPVTYKSKGRGLAVATKEMNMGKIASKSNSWPLESLWFPYDDGQGMQT